MNVNNSFNPPQFDLSQTPQESNDPSDSTGKPPSQGQGKGGPDISTTGGTSAYASLQGPQGQVVTSDQSTTLGQTLGAVQGLTDDSSLPGVINNAPDGTTVDSLVANIGLLPGQQVAPQGGAKDHKGSGSGSGGQSEPGDVYILSAAAALQKGTTSSPLVGSTTSSKNISTFTLKIDPSTTSTDTTSTTGTTSTTPTTDVNGAPTIAPAPNVFDMIEESASLSSQLQLEQVSQMVSSSDAENAILAIEYTQQINDINSYIKAQNSSNKKSSAAQAFSWVVNIAMIAVGTVTEDPMLIAAGVAGCIMTADPKIAAGLSSALEKMFPGLPPAVANIMSTLIIVGATSVATCGAGAIVSGAMEEGSDAAINASANAITDASTASTTASTDASANASTASITDSIDASASTAAKTAAKKTATTSVKQPINWSQTAKALGTSQGRSAFVDGAMRGAAKTISEAPSDLASAIAKTPQSMANSARSLYQFSSRMASQCSALGSIGLRDTAADAGAVAGKSATMSERAIAQLQSFGSNIESMASNMLKSPIKMMHITADLTMAALTLTGQVETYNATVLKAKAEEDQGTVLQSQSETTAMTALISLANQQIQQVLDDMQSDISSTAAALKQMSSLSTETLGYLNGAGA